MDDYFGDIIHEIGNVTDDCAELIGQEQISQIRALKVENESLKSQLREKAEYVALLEKNPFNARKKSAIESNNQFGEVISDIIEKLIASIPSEKSGLIDRLHEIGSIKDDKQKIRELVEFASKLNDYKSKFSIPRLCSVIQGHVEFLTRLAESPELQSLFLVSSNSGETFLPETTRNLILEQAARTSRFLEKPPTMKSEFGDISKVLDLNVDCSKRLQQFTNFLQSDNVSNDEVRVLLLQEFAISNALRHYSETLKQSCEQINSQNLEYKKAFKSLAEVLNNNDGNVSSIVNLTQELKRQFLEMKKQLQKQDDKKSESSRSSKSIEEINQDNQKKTAKIQELNDNIGAFQKEIQKKDEKINNLQQTQNKIVQEIQKKDETINQLKENINELQRQIQKLENNDVDELQQKVQELQRENVRLQKEKQDEKVKHQNKEQKKQEQYENNENKYKQQIKQLQDLQLQQQQKLQTEIDQLRKQIQEQQSENQSPQKWQSNKVRRNERESKESDYSSSSSHQEDHFSSRSKSKDNRLSNNQQDFSPRSQNSYSSSKKQKYTQEPLENYSSKHQKYNSENSDSSSSSKKQKRISKTPDRHSSSKDQDRMINTPDNYSSSKPHRPSSNAPDNYSSINQQNYYAKTPDHYSSTALPNYYTKTPDNYSSINRHNYYTRTPDNYSSMKQQNHSSKSPYNYSSPKQHNYASNQIDNPSSRTCDEWSQWGQRLYYALTGVSSNDLGSDDVRTAIEEAALTAVGNPKVQSFLKNFSRTKGSKHKY